MLPCPCFVATGEQEFPHFLVYEAAGGRLQPLCPVNGAHPVSTSSGHPPTLRLTSFPDIDHGRMQVDDVPAAFRTGNITISTQMVK